MKRIEAWIMFAAAAMTSDAGESIEKQAEWADVMLAECDERWVRTRDDEEYTGSAK